jgi:hypothetical protein
MVGAAAGRRHYFRLVSHTLQQGEAESRAPATLLNQDGVRSSHRMNE